MKNLVVCSMGIQELNKKEMTGVNGGCNVTWPFVGFVVACAIPGVGWAAALRGAWAIGRLVHAAMSHQTS